MSPYCNFIFFAASARSARFAATARLMMLRDSGKTGHLRVTEPCIGRAIQSALSRKRFPDGETCRVGRVGPSLRILAVLWASCMASS